MLKLLNFLFTWQDTHYQYQYGCNKDDCRSASYVPLFKDSTSHMFKMNPDTFLTGEIKNERLLSPSDFC
jgi:hypothetical protein